MWLQTGASQGTKAAYVWKTWLQKISQLLFYGFSIDFLLLLPEKSSQTILKQASKLLDSCCLYIVFPLFMTSFYYSSKIVVCTCFYFLFFYFYILNVKFHFTSQSTRFERQSCTKKYSNKKSLMSNPSEISSNDRIKPLYVIGATLKYITYVYMFKK